MRTFIAIEIPSTIHSQICQHQQALDAILAADHHGNSIRWTPPANVHITLRFLGATTAHQCQAIQRSLTAISATQQPFRLSIGKLGCFPNRQTPNVVWLGIDDADNALLPLQQQVEQAAQIAGYAPETKFFTPHITIGRLRRTSTRPQSKRIGQSLARQWDIDVPQPQPPASFVVNQLVHMQSQLQPAGAVYTPLQMFTFTEKQLAE